MQGSVAGWGSEAEEAAALARLQAPQVVTPASLVKLIAAVREGLPRLPQRAVAPLCSRVHVATLQLLGKLALPDKQSEMAREQVSACAEVCLPAGSGSALHPGDDHTPTSDVACQVHNTI